MKIETEEEELERFGIAMFSVKEYDTEFIVKQKKSDMFLRPSGKMKDTIGYTEDRNVGSYKTIEKVFEAIKTYHTREKVRTKYINKLSNKNEKSKISLDLAKKVIDAMLEELD